MSENTAICTGGSVECEKNGRSMSKPAESVVLLHLSLKSRSQIKVKVAYEEFSRSKRDLRRNV